MPLVVAGEDKAEARRLQRMAAQGQLRRIYRGIYTDDLPQPIEAIIRRELYALCALIVPGSIISHRSALESRPTAGGNYYLSGRYRREIELPGVRLRIGEGPGPLDSDIRIPTFGGDAFVSSQARALLENLSSSRGDPTEKRTLGTTAVEEWLDRFIGRDVGGSINRIRDTARTIAESLGLTHEFKQLDATIGALLGTRSARLSAPVAIARAARKPYDSARLELFEVLAVELQRNPLQVPPADPKADPHLQAFVETYFSNYIEGTEFEIKEAHDIVVTGRPMKYREDDSHDILGTYQAILKSKQSPVIPATAEAFLKQLQEWNRQVIESRLDKNPGEIKTEPNRAGQTYFVSPEMVVGTLMKGYEIIMSAATPANRAAIATFVVSEVHPFTDGNGRTARVAMNHFLTEAGLTRIIVPTVFRDDYISALKALSSNAHPVPLVRMLARAAHFSRWLDMTSTTHCFAALTRSNAMQRPEDAQLVFSDSQLAAVPAGTTNSPAQ
ncbi:MAG: Fic family protein [Steroidobacteraceae bacterium]